MYIVKSFSRVVYNNMVECTKEYVRDCVKDHVPANDIEAFLNEAAKKLKSEDFYCTDGLFSPPVLTDEQKREIPCNETFYNQSEVCGDTFQTKFRGNRADMTLCKYVESVHVYSLIMFFCSVKILYSYFVCDLSIMKVKRFFFKVLGLCRIYRKIIRDSINAV